MEDESRESDDLSEHDDDQPFDAKGSTPLQQEMKVRSWTRQTCTLPLKSALPSTLPASIELATTFMTASLEASARLAKGGG